MHYAAKAFLCGEIARWIDQEGLCLDVATGGELAVALHAGFPAQRITLHGNNRPASGFALSARWASLGLHAPRIT